jgi:Fe-S cluster biogenesis protein NfuA/nitrite reductase/ring-hydroxylating ferredoxin subunit
MTVTDRAAPDRADAPGHRPTDAEDALDARHVAERVGMLLAEIGGIADPRLTERIEELVSQLMQFYGAGIRRILETADNDGLLEGRLLDDLINDELVSSLLVIHDLHPLDLPTRVQRAIDRVRPYLGSHGGDVEVVGIEGDVVRLRMEGSCSSCPSSSVTLNYAIEKAILDAAPEIARIEAEGVEAPPRTPLIQLDARRPAIGGATEAGAVETRTEWLPLESDRSPAVGDMAAVEVGGLRLVVCRSGEDLYAYRDLCPNCRSPLETGQLSDAVLTCRSCGHGFDVRLAGRSVAGDGFHLEPLPLLVEAGIVRIAVPVPVAAVGLA